MIFFFIIFPLVNCLPIQSQLPPPIYHNPRYYTSTVPTTDTYLTFPNIRYYPPSPTSAPGFSKYGSVPYQDKYLQKNAVKAALAWKDLLRNYHHHKKYNIEVIDTTERNIHDVFRERYTTKLIPHQIKLDGFESYNLLEMTNYVSMKNEGHVFLEKGNQSCVSIYNTKALTEWHKKHVETFKKQFPNSTFPLYNQGNTTDEKFEIKPGRTIHREPVTITCCGVNREKTSVYAHITGYHPYVNCYTTMGYIPLRKLLFSRIEQPTTESGEWYEIDVYSVEENNATSSRENTVEVDKSNKNNGTEHTEENTTITTEEISTITIVQDEKNIIEKTQDKIEQEENEKNATKTEINLQEEEEETLTTTELTTTAIPTTEITTTTTTTTAVTTTTTITTPTAIVTTTDDNPPHEMYIKGLKVLVRERKY